jgi:hypothetical protein
MNIEQKMEYIRRALELGATVDVKWYFLEDEDKARELIANLKKKRFHLSKRKVKKLTGFKPTIIKTTLILLFSLKKSTWKKMWT